MAGGLAGVGYRWQHSGPAPAPHAGAAPSRTQRTLLIQVRGVGGDALASALLAADPRTQQAAVVLVPSRVVAEVPGSGPGPYGQALGRAGGAALSRSTLADLLGVTVDGSWVLDRPVLSALVDRVGGIDVDVDTDVIVTGAGGPVVAVPQGAGQRLSGAQALAVLNYRVPGEDELAALPRLQRVVLALLARLPAGSAALTRLLADLGPGSQVSDAAVATGVLDGTRRDVAADRATYQILPVLAVDGGGAATYRLDVAGVNALAARQLAASRLAGHAATGNRVLVLNQAGGVGLGQHIRDRIVSKGFVFVDSRNQTPFDRHRTVVVVFDTRPPTLAGAGRLAAALGLPAAPVQVSPRAQNIADLIVIVGTDFRP